MNRVRTNERGINRKGEIGKTNIHPTVSDEPTKMARPHRAGAMDMTVLPEEVPAAAVLRLDIHPEEAENHRPTTTGMGPMGHHLPIGMARIIMTFPPTHLLIIIGMSTGIETVARHHRLGMVHPEEIEDLPVEGIVMDRHGNSSRSREEEGEDRRKQNHKVDDLVVVVVVEEIPTHQALDEDKMNSVRGL